MVLYAASPSTGNGQLQRIGLSPGARIGMWVLVSIIILFIVIGLWRMLCRSSRIYGPGPQISGEGIRERRQQPTVAADIELAQAQAPAPALALTLECMYRSADGWAEQTCSVCMSELTDGDMLRVLMVCKHSSTLPASSHGCAGTTPARSAALPQLPKAARTWGREPK